MTFKPKRVSLTKRDLKELSTNYLKYVVKNSDDKQLINNCKLEIELRSKPRPINPL